MRIEPLTDRTSSFGRIRFADKVERAIARSAGTPTSMRVATWPEIERVLDEAGRMFDVATPGAVRRMHARNGDIFRVVEGLGEQPTMIAYLPLNEAGHRALLGGTLDGRAPDPSMIVTGDELPDAVYIWMTWSPGRLAAALPRFAELFRQLSPSGCPLYSRAVNRHAERLNSTIGFRSARETTPDAPEWLLVIHPEAEPPARAAITTRPVRTFEDMAMVYSVRSATYLAEQFCLHAEEFDGNDFCATQLLGFVDGDPAGCVRMRYFGDFVKVERLAVRREYRQSRLAFRLVRDALKLARRKGFSRFYGHARADLVPFWSMFGFREMDERPSFRFADLDYREMVLDGTGEDDAVRLGGDPMVTIRPEGDWSAPGPLELSNSRPSRAALFRGTMKSLPVGQRGG